MDKQQLNEDPYLKLFWCTLVVSIFAFIIFTITAIFSVKAHKVCFSYECLNFFFSKVMFVPLSCLAASLPICAIFLTLHKSNQTKIQIAQSSEQNKTANYFMHRKEFGELCRKIEEEHPVSINWQDVYNKIFANNINNETVNLSYNSTKSNYFSQDKRFFDLLESLVLKHGSADVSDAISLLHEINAFEESSGIQIKVKGSVQKLYLKDTMGGLDIKHYMPLKLVNGMISETWGLYFTIMRELAFFSGISYSYEKYESAIKRYDYVLLSKERVVKKPGD
ncbi:hypothetical protein [Pseudoalteromonas shioyasakiensis]|uniref:hypothetical protein n=1 Tax=Pseudoalteromonas shioyasakiensis TaxID=1190813 RepID=UPI0022B0EA59|nr:hypothetical protein [Pseudoalteromonas shioyasakiensis]MCZ4249934.1 hypothetical protein [Pseudoalteromonas shioyasakiensis]